MRMLKILKNGALYLPMLLLLASCAAQEPERADTGVEDLSPGDRTVITAPGRPEGSQSGVRERNI